MILLIDNYDSFTYNLAHLFGELGAEVRGAPERRDRRRRGGAARAVAPRRLPRSRPARGRGHSLGVVERLAGARPTLGVCLGHQAIVEVFGGEVG